MPERIDHVSVAVDRGGETNAVRLPWKSRDYLLRKLRATDGAEGIVTAFEEVGATSPVELTTAQKAVLYRVLDDRSFTTGFHELPVGFFELRNALADEAADAAQNEQLVGPRPPLDEIASLREDIKLISAWINLATQRDADAIVVQAAGMVRDERQARLDQLELQ
jgi:nucleotide-binding universal stress UspA family protein